MCHSHLYFAFNTLLMPQWIKIQSLLEINNTQNIQRILEYFTVRVPKTSSDRTWTNVPTAAASQMTQRGLRPHSNHIHRCFLVSLISILNVKSFCVETETRRGTLREYYAECIPDWPVACYNAVSLHTSRGQNSKHSGQSFHSILPHRLRGMYKEEGKFFSLLAVFNHIIWRN